MTTNCMICKENPVPPPIEIAFPDTPCCKDCLEQLKLFFGDCKTEQQRMDRMEVLVQLGKVMNK